MAPVNAYHAWQFGAAQRISGSQCFIDNWWIFAIFIFREKSGVLGNFNTLKHKSFSDSTLEINWKQDVIIYIGEESIQHCIYITLSKDTVLKVMQYPA